MKKRILLIGYNYHPEPTGIGKYNGEMMKWLAQNGYDCEVITTYPYYPYWKVQEPYNKYRFWYKTETEHSPMGASIKVHRCPMYVPAKPSGIKRILLDLSFCISAFFKLIQLIFGKRFDVVIVVVPSFQFGLLGLLYKKLKKAKLVYHIQDMQIEAARDLGMIKSEKILGALFKLENYIFKHSDYISTISVGMVKKIEAKTRSSVILFPNWTDVNEFRPLADHKELKRNFGFDPKDKIVLYSGAIGEKQGLEAIIHAAESFRDRANVKFLICGSGPYKENMQRLAKELDLPNVIFFPLQPYEKFNSFLNMADAHLVIQKANAGDLVMPSKLTTILAVGGLAVVTASNGSGLHDLISSHKMGILISPENTAALIDGITAVLENDPAEMKRSARLYAEEYLSIDSIFNAFAKKVIE